jgi:hypothetical protein
MSQHAVSVASLVAFAVIVVWNVVTMRRAK